MAKSLYTCEQYKLSELLDKATRNASILVPDLQRPYIWLPSQVALLIDSIFRGWPFGTLLTWTVKREATRNLGEGIPARSFYTLVSRCSEVSETVARIRDANYDTEDSMVLDGQQRLQSLILAFGDTDGICMYDSDWDKERNPKSRARSKNGYTTAGLCLDLEKYLTEMQRCKYCRYINLVDCLSWAVLKPELCSRNHRGGKSPVPLANSDDGCYIPLKFLWNMTDASRNEEEDLDPVAQKILNGAFGSEQRKQQLCDKFGGFDEVKRSVRKILRRCCDIKELYITCLNVRAHEENPAATDDQRHLERQEYNEAIVNIFTRLNTAGRALSREEITFAWVKSTWNEVDVIGNAYPKAEVFVDRIMEIFSAWNLTVDNVIGALSVIWCNHDPDRRGARLADRELLQAGIIRKMSGFLHENADTLVATAEKICELYEECHLSNVTDSFNDMTIAWDLYFTGELARNRVMNGRKEHDKDNAKKALDNIARFFIARWAPIPSWGRYWAVQSVPFLEKTMDTMYKGIVNVATATDEPAWRDRLKELASLVNSNAISDAKTNLRMRLSERKVFLYRSRLEIWQGLDEARAKFRSLTFRTAADKGEVQLNVDHIVAYALWKKMIENAFKNNVLTVEKAATVLLGMPPEEVASHLEIEGFEAEVKRDSVEFINNIGNCMLLNAGYNISKRVKPLSEFMDDMYEFKPDTPDSNRVDKKQWLDAMKLTNELVDPRNHTIEGIANAIRVREKQIYDELEQFVSASEPVLY